MCCLSKFQGILHVSRILCLILLFYICIVFLDECYGTRFCIGRQSKQANPLCPLDWPKIA